MRKVQGEARRSRQRRTLEASQITNGDSAAPPKPDVDSDSSDSDDSDCFSDSLSNADSDTSYTDHSDDDDVVAQEQPKPKLGNFYRDMIQELERQGPTLADRCDGTKKKVQAERTKWEEFCKVLSQDLTDDEEKPVEIDPVELVKRCHAPSYKAYLHWRCRSSEGGIKKESTILAYWKNLSMWYCDMAHDFMNSKVLFDVGNWISVELGPEFALDTTIKNKSGLFVGDVDVMLHEFLVVDKNVLLHERLRVQLPAIIILAGATSTRPGALIENLCYKDIEIHVFAPEPGSTRARIGMVIKLRKTKRTAGRSRPKKYGFHEEDTLLRDPILYIESLAFADGAFLNDFKDPEDIRAKLCPPEGQSSMIVPWKDEWKERPIFRDTQGRGKDVCIAIDRAFRYGKARSLLVRLGRALGYEKMLEWYDLRRASGKKLNRALTAEERNHSMGHILGDSSTYVRFYMADYIDADFQEIVFGSEPQRDLIELMGRLVRRADAPTHLTDEQLAEVNRHPRLVRLKRKKRLTVRKMKRNGWTVKTVPQTDEGAEVLQEYIRWSRMVDSLRKTLQDVRLRTAINDFHKVRDGKEIARQLDGIKPSQYLSRPDPEYQLPSRARVAKLFVSVADATSRDQLFEIRMNLIRGLRDLCHQREPPRPRKKKTTPLESQSTEQSIQQGTAAQPRKQTRKPRRPMPARSRKKAVSATQSDDSTTTGIQSSFAGLTLEPETPGDSTFDGGTMWSGSFNAIPESTGGPLPRFSFESCMGSFSPHQAIDGTEGWKE